MTGMSSISWSPVCDGSVGLTFCIRYERGLAVSLIHSDLLCWLVRTLVFLRRVISSIGLLCLSANVMLCSPVLQVGYRMLVIGLAFCGLSGS